MKKNFLKSALLMMALGMAFVSCQDDVADELTIGTGEDGVKEVTINRIGGIIELPIVTNTEWKASLPADCDWVGLSDSIGTGNHTLEIFVDYNDPRFAEERRVDLVVTAGDQTKSIRVRQYVGITDGENAAYISDELGFNDLYLTRGLGQGINISATKEIEMVKNPLFTKATLDALAKQNPLYKDIVTETSDPQLIGQVGVKDSLSAKPEHLGVKATINVAYGLFKLDIYGEYIMGNFTERNNYKFDVSYEVPRVMATVDAPTLEAIADEENTVKYAFTPGFTRARQNVINSITAAKLSDDEYEKLAECDPATWETSKMKKIKSALTQLNTNYGAVYVSQTKLGGSCTMHIECDTTAIQDTTIVSGQIKTAITVGLLKVDADVSASYSQLATSILRNGSYAFSIRGGSSDTNQNLTQSLGIDKSKIDAVGINKELAKWMGTIPTELTSDVAKQNMSVIDMGYMPIWGMFPFEYSDIIRAWYIMHYKDKKTLVNLEEL
ncbi:MAG: BACON domain-containing protein [Bacteroidaceae bacterium]|nr:BACON domain-containing protein [Bacteroidaceae bacterium]